jgi:hypothetical protein
MKALPEHDVTHALEFRESMAKKIGRSRERQCCAELSMFLGRLKRAMFSANDPF